jgi:K+ potassium transporter C-terminal domain
VHHVERSRSLHETVILLTVQGASTPVVADHERYKLAALGVGYGWISPFSMSRADIESPLKSEDPMLTGITKPSWTAHASSDTLLPI